MSEDIKSLWAGSLENLFGPAEQQVEARRAQRRRQAEVMHVLITTVSLAFFGFLALGFAQGGARVFCAAIGVGVALWQLRELLRARRPLPPYHGQWRRYLDPTLLSHIAREPEKLWLQGLAGEGVIEVDARNAGAIDALVAVSQRLPIRPEVFVGPHVSKFWHAKVMLAIQDDGDDELRSGP